MTRDEFEQALRARGLIGEAPLPPRAGAAMPWHLTVASGTGAWLAACLLLAFLGGTLGRVLESAPVRGLIGAVVCAAAPRVVAALGLGPGEDRGAQRPFAEQFFLVVSLAGALLLGSAVIVVGHGVVLQTGAVALLAGGLYLYNPEPVHRTVMAWTVVGALAGVGMLLRAEPLVSALLAAACAAIWLAQAPLTARGHSDVPRTFGVACALALMLMQLPDVASVTELIEKTVRLAPGRTAMLRAALLCAVLAVSGIVIARRLAAGGGRVPPGAVFAIVGGCALLAAATAKIPGIAACVLVWVLGTWAARAGLRRIALLGLAGYLYMLYFSMNSTLMAKGVALIGTAAVLLAMGFVLARAGGRRS